MRRSLAQVDKAVQWGIMLLLAYRFAPDEVTHFCPATGAEEFYHQRSVTGLRGSLYERHTSRRRR